MNASPFQRRPRELHLTLSYVLNNSCAYFLQISRMILNFLNMLRLHSPVKKYALVKRSLVYQTSEFFKNSTLHGVRYIAETGRPFFDRFLWTCCTAVGATVTLIIIVSLWEKFQTNPTITGLDTDFHNWDVEFPGVTICQEKPANLLRAKELAQSGKYKGPGASLEDYFAFLGNLNIFSEDMGNFSDPMFPKTGLREITLEVVNRCEDIISDCKWKDEDVSNEDCCSWIKPTFTENGFCFGFNIRPSVGLLYWNGTVVTGDFTPNFIYETDPSWAFQLNIADAEDNPVSIFIHSSNELPSIDMNANHVWDERISKIAFSAKTTYTTEDTLQLSIKQRHCVFPQEIKLIGDAEYTYGGCMRDCRMARTFKKCNCIPMFYRPVTEYPFCDLNGYICISEHLDWIIDKTKCSCELSCEHTVYEVEKLTEMNVDVDKGIELSYVSWPMIRYKREVLFGWVDLLVAFGGIAGLFLGFSLLSGVEIIYYFTMRACCMISRETETLEKLQREYELAPKPPLDLTLTPYFMLKNNEPMEEKLTRVQPKHPEPERY